MIHLRRTVLFSAIFILTLIAPLTIQADDGPEWRGTISSRPAGLTGTWVIGGLSFEATGATQFEQEHGSLTAGACAEVKYYTSSGVNYATKIESEEAYKCGGGGGGGTPGQSYKIYATVNSFPASLYGTWIIGGVTYTSDSSTKFEQEHGPFAVGGCVEVKYVSGSNLILELETESGYKCVAGGNVPPDTSFSQVYGVLDNFPAGLTGTWVVDGVNYTASTSTRFEQEHGSFFVGGCVEVKYQAAANNAVEISTEEAYKCSGGGGNPAKSKFYGLVGSIPPDPQNGTWMIDNGPFVSTATTQLKEEHGTFAVGVCVEVEYYQDAIGDHVATEIGTEEPYKCNSSTYTNEVYGLITSFPAGLYGSWVIDNDSSYNAGAGTQFEQDHGAFATGVCIKVKYYTQNGIHHATKIESEESSKCGSGGTPSLPGNNSKVYATIDSFPASPYIGPWSIGGVTYQATSATQFEQEHGAFANGTCVKAKYTASGGVNTLIKVETEKLYKCQASGGGSPEFKSYGVIEAFPSGLIGTWQVSGIVYEADSSTTFEQDHGFFAIGAYVEVKYIASGGTNTAVKIETHVAPGAGLSIITGRLDTRPDDDWDEWVVDGTSYKADPAIEVDSGVGSPGTTGVSASAAPVEGELVIMRSYRSNGQTFITSAALGKPIFLPIIFR